MEDQQLGEAMDVSVPSTKLWLKYIYWAIGAVLGSVGGYFYWKYWGCDGACLITSVWWRTSVYGAVVGGMIADNIWPARMRKAVDKSLIKQTDLNE